MNTLTPGRLRQRDDSNGGDELTYFDARTPICGTYTLTIVHGRRTAPRTGPSLLAATVALLAVAVLLAAYCVVLVWAGRGGRS